MLLECQCAPGPLHPTGCLLVNLVTCSRYIVFQSTPEPGPTVAEVRSALGQLPRRSQYLPTTLTAGVVSQVKWAWPSGPCVPALASLGAGDQRRTSAQAPAALAYCTVSVGDESDRDSLSLVEDDVLPMVYHSPVCSRLSQNRVEPARGQAKQGKEAECRSRLAQKNNVRR